MSVLIYALRDPRSGQVFYVGESVHPLKRWIDHQYQRKFCATYNKHLSALLQELWSQGFRPMLQIIEKCESNWRERERFWISEYRKKGFQLLNVDGGGRARTGGQVGHPCPEWWKKELSRRNKGRKRSEETKRKIRDSNLKAWTPEKRLSHSALMSGQTKAWWNSLTPERRGELSKAYSERNKRKVVPHGFALLTPEQRTEIARIGGFACKGKPKRRRLLAVL